MRMRRENLIARGFLVMVAGTIFVFAGAWMYLFLGLKAGDTMITDQRGNWTAFYRDDFSQHFHIPNDASIIRAESFSDFFMGGGAKVELTLPKNKTPEEWLRHIAHRTPNLYKYKVSALDYDGSRKATDVYRIHYRPHDGRFIAEWAWD